MLISDVIRRGLGPAASEVCVLMGANVADEVARDEVGRQTLDWGGMTIWVSVIAADSCEAVAPKTNTHARSFARRQSAAETGRRGRCYSR